MCTRRRLPAASVLFVVAITVVSAGVPTVQQTLTAEGRPAVVPDAALESTGYRLVDRRTVDLVETVEAPGGEAITLHGRSPAVEYRRTVDLGFLGSFEVGAFATIAIPAFEANGTVLNPIVGSDNLAVAALVEERFPTLRVGDAVENRTVVALGQRSEVTTFDGTAALGETTLPVFVHVTRLRSGDDYVVVVGVHPAVFPNERDRLFALLSALEHPGATNGTSVGEPETPPTS